MIGMENLKKLAQLKKKTELGNLIGSESKRIVKILQGHSETIFNDFNKTVKSIYHNTHSLNSTAAKPSIPLLDPEQTLRAIK